MDLKPSRHRTGEVSEYGPFQGLRERMPERDKNATWNSYRPQMTADHADRQLDIFNHRRHVVMH